MKATLKLLLASLVVGSFEAFPIVYHSGLKHRQWQLEKLYTTTHHEYELVDHWNITQEETLVDALVSSKRFSSKSQAKKACRHQQILLAKSNKPSLRSVGSTDFIHYVEENATTKCSPGDTVGILTRSDNPDSYPIEVTQFVFPPLENHDSLVVFEDDLLAIVDKPENLTTIGTKRGDLQSRLGFILRPPVACSSALSYHPRPVHRLDRRTSGLVLVAKSQNTMKFLSQAFASRNVTKTYTALVVWNDKYDFSNSSEQWQKIDYPIDKRPAVSQWRATEINPPLALIQVRPHTGRTHQIRRHLSYCLGMPIAGDSKYDKGKQNCQYRTDGMYLCCHELEFPYPNMSGNMAPIENNPNVRFLENGGRLKISIPLPSKFRKRLQDIRSSP